MWQVVVIPENRIVGGHGQDQGVGPYPVVAPGVTRYAVAQFVVAIAAALWISELYLEQGLVAILMPCLGLYSSCPRCCSRFTSRRTGCRDSPGLSSGSMCWVPWPRFR